MKPFFGKFVLLICVWMGVMYSEPRIADAISLFSSAEHPFINAWESFSYPLDLFEDTPNTAGDSINGASGGINTSDVNGEGGWTSSWVLEATSYEAVLSDTQIDTERIVHQDAYLFPGSFSLDIRTPAINGPKRMFLPTSSGDLWISFLFQDTGPAEDHDAGVFILDATGTKHFLIGKPRNSDMLGISHLPISATDQLTNISYLDPHHLLVRLVLDKEPGMRDDVYLWVDPDENDRLDTYDAGAEDIADLDDAAGIMLSRRQDTGDGFFDDIDISSLAALPPAGSIHVDLGLLPLSPLRQNSDIVWHDVISIDGFGDGFGGTGYGHNQDQDYFMVVRGFIYFTDEGASRVARGIPIDRMSGLEGFAIGPFNDSLVDSAPMSGKKNVLRFAPDNGTTVAVKLDVTAGNYAQCRVLTSGDGYGTLAVQFTYEDGTTQDGEFRSPDWLDDSVDDGHGGLIPTDILQINNGMDRLAKYSYFEGSDPWTGENPELDDASFFSDRLALDQSKKLTGINLGPSSGSVVNVYDLLLDIETDLTPVRNWMIFE